ncbi:MAG: hypothetical protein ACFE95_20205, partial [Candidatus Hodarchaeota archaeon]
MAYRNCWIFVKYIYEVVDEFLLKITALSICFILILANLWIRSTFPVFPSNSRFNNLISGLFWLSLGYSVILLPLSVLFPPDLVRNDMNMALVFLFGILQILLSFQIILRVGYVWRRITSEIQWYYFVLLTGVFLIIFSNLLFFWLDHAILHQVAPMIGYIILLFALTSTRVFPLFQFATTVNAGIILVNKDQSVVYTNKESHQYINPLVFKDKSSVKLSDLWPNQEKIILKAFNTVIQELRSVQVEERFFNYVKETVQNIQLTFYPLGAQNLTNPIRVGIMLLHSDEIEFLKQRKAFLFDVATHDIANVCQTLHLSHESLSKADFTHEKSFETFQLAKNQINRLAQLVYCVQNLLIIDEISSSPSEIYSDFNERMNNLIDEKYRANPDFEFIRDGLSELRTIQTTGNLKAGFSLLLDSIFETCTKKEIYITSNIRETEQLQEVIFMFDGEELNVTLLESYSNEKKSELTAGSSARVNLIVAGSIIQ